MSWSYYILVEAPGGTRDDPGSVVTIEGTEGKGEAPGVIIESPGGTIQGVGT